MRPAAELRREGMADACVLLVAGKVLPKMGIEEWGQLLGLEQVELREAIRRWQVAQYEAAGVRLPVALGGKPPPEPKKARLRVVRTGPVERTIPCTTDGCDRLFGDVRGLKAHVRTVHTRVECPECGGSFTAGGLGPHRLVHRRAAVAALDAAESRPAASGTGAAGHA